MTFTKAIKILDLLNHDKEIIVKKDIYDGLTDMDEDGLEFIDRFSKHDEISDCLEYFTNPSYHFFVNDGNDFTGEEIWN